jgi:hypothetical protein
MTPDEQKKMSVIPYASAIGSIMYAMLCTRPDVSFALSVTGRYQSDFGEDHWTVVKGILKYLRRTKDMFLITTRNVAICDDLLVTPLTFVIEWYVICDEISIFVIGAK